MPALRFSSWPSSPLQNDSDYDMVDSMYTKFNVSCSIRVDRSPVRARALFRISGTCAGGSGLVGVGGDEAKFKNRETFTLLDATGVVDDFEYSVLFPY